MFKDMTDAGLADAIVVTRSLLDNAVAMKKPYGVGKMLRDLDIAIAVKRSRMRAGTWTLPY